MTRLRCVLLLAVLLAPRLSAQTVSWQQDAPVNPSDWTYRLYFDVGPALVTGVVCTGTPPEFDCTAPFQPLPGWTVAYMTAENPTGESLPSNPIYSSTPIELPIAAAPKNLRLVP